MDQETITSYTLNHAFLLLQIINLSYLQTRINGTGLLWLSGEFILSTLYFASWSNTLEIVLSLMLLRFGMPYNVYNANLPE